MMAQSVTKPPYVVACGLQRNKNEDCWVGRQIQGNQDPRKGSQQLSHHRGTAATSRKSTPVHCGTEISKANLISQLRRKPAPPTELRWLVKTLAKNQGHARDEGAPSPGTHTSRTHRLSFSPLPHSHPRDRWWRAFPDSPPACQEDKFNCRLATPPCAPRQRGRLEKCLPSSKITEPPWEFTKAA